MMKFRIKFKDTDGIWDLCHALNAPRVKALVEAGMDEDAAMDHVADDPESFGRRFFRWGDCGCVEIDVDQTGVGTARLLPVDQW